jgi:Skp family chaperone for outer membrane proteins
MRSYLVIALSCTLLISCGGSEGEESTKEIAPVEVKSFDGLKIGYYNTDSIALNFEYYVAELGTLEKRGAELERKGAALQSKYEKKMMEYQRGMQSNSLSANQVQNYETQLGKLQGELGQFQQVELAEFQNLQLKSNEVLMNKIGQYSQEFAKNNGLTLFFALSKPSGLSASVPALAYADTTLDMTMPFINYMNKKESEINNSSAE